MHINLFGVIILVINLYSCITLLFNTAAVTPMVEHAVYQLEGQGSDPCLLWSACCILEVSLDKRVNLE